MKASSFPPFTKALSSVNIVRDPTLDSALCLKDGSLSAGCAKRVEAGSANLGAQVADLLLLVVHHPLQLRLALLRLPVVLVVKPGHLSQLICGAAKP